MKKSRCMKSPVWVSLLLNTLVLSGCIQPNNSRHPDKIHEILKLPHKNREGIEKAPDFFINQKDPLKTRSIFFLVGNITDKYSLIPANGQDPLRPIILNNYIKEKEAWDLGKSRLGIALDSVYKTCTDPPRPKIVRDIEVTTGNFLINNVGEAIKVWHCTKKFMECSFDDFCEHILPYRIGNELLSDWREQAYQKFPYLLDSISDPLELIKVIVQVSGIYYNAGMNEYPFLPTFSKLDQLHWGSCDHLIVYPTLSLRAIGIPSTIDVIPAWANRSGGRAWGVVINKDGRFVDVRLNGRGHNSILYKIPKIYKIRYSSNRGGIGYLGPLWKDVMGEYPMPISDIALSGSDPDMKGDVLFLYIFNNKDWIPVAVSVTEDKKIITFGNVARGIPFGNDRVAEHQNEGKGIVYFLVSVRNGVVAPFATPFILKENGDVRGLTPDHSVLRSASSYRKHPRYGCVSVCTARMVGGRSGKGVEERIFVYINNGQIWWRQR